MKKFILLSTAVMTILSSNVYGANLTVNGKDVNSNVQIENDKSMLSVRDLLEALNYSVGWDSETKTVTANSDITLENDGDIANAKPIFGLGDEFATENFTGKVYLNNFANNGGVSIGNVTFDKGCINKWHIHDHVQVLMGTMGKGYAQMEGQDAQTINPGDVVVIPAGTKHWHGASKDSQFTHISVSGPVVEGMEAFGTNWLEPVDQDEYDKLN